MKATLVISAAAALATVGVAASAVADDKPAPRQLVFLSVHGPNTLDQGGPLQPGDDGVFLDDVYNATRTKKLGTSAVHCVQNFADILNCTGTAHLDGRGDIVFTGATQRAETFVLAVVGGTGEFRGANGEAEIFTVDDQTDRTIVRLTK